MMTAKASYANILVGVAEKMMKSLGGKLESFYFAFGDDDLYVISERPDNVTALLSRLQ
jgi:uncharacterized protein with GYD domain